MHREAVGVVCSLVPKLHLGTRLSAKLSFASCRPNGTVARRSTATGAGAKVLRTARFAGKRGRSQMKFGNEGDNARSRGVAGPPERTRDGVLIKRWDNHARTVTHVSQSCLGDLRGIPLSVFTGKRSGGNEERVLYWIDFNHLYSFFCALNPMALPGSLS